ncbi:MAG: peptidylprolyl isomerase [Spirochaetaceae bacterium]|nr:peptidylprolyl isomerase [Spirochaetaceae bacterium]
MAACEEAKNLPEGLSAVMETTRGEIIISLEFEKTPLTVINFVGLAEGKMNTDAKSGPYYDGLKFHRVIADFMIQGGDPQGTGSGGPGYQFDDEIDDSLKFSGPGILAMANAGPGTNGSQFFITHVATPHLQGKHTIFGHVVGDGQKVVNAIKQGDEIKKITIIRNGAAAEAFKADQDAFNEINKGLVEAAKKKAEEADKAILDEISNRWPNAVVTDSGIRYVIKKEGTGKTPPSGTMVTVHYTGMFMDGRIFDSSVERKQPFEFTVGASQVIRGWDETVLSMKKGEKRTIILPPELAYGSRGAGGVIPPNTWLVFEVELINY